MKKFVLLIATALFLLADANAFDVRLLANNKEAISRELTQAEMTQVEQWVTQHPLGAELKNQAFLALTSTFNEMEKVDTTCELGLVARLGSDAIKFGLITHQDDFLLMVRYLRFANMIDDILFRMIRESGHVADDFVKNAGLRKPGRPFNLVTRLNAGIDLEKFYAPVKQWPDDVKKCTLDTYWNMVSKLQYASSKDRDKQMEKLNYLAYTRGVINLETFNRMETMRKRSVLDWPIYFKRYADVINNSKDRMTKTPETEAKNDFLTEYVSRRDGLTQRGNLYATYNSTQIMILAQIIEKTAKRMDATMASIHWQYTEDPNGEQEIYVLSPMEQYRAAIKMLRKDMAEVMRSDAFKNSGLEYDHLIAAAYETGFIKSEELDYVAKFEEFWDPKTPRWRAYADFAFSLAKTGTIYLPPPWNIIGAIGLVLTQTKLIKGNKQPDPDDNWNVII